MPIGKAMVSEHGLKPCARQWRFDLQMRDRLLAFDQPVFPYALACAGRPEAGAINAQRLRIWERSMRPALRPEPCHPRPL